MRPDRKPQPGHLLFDPSIDELLAKELFDGKPSAHRLGLLDLLISRTHPEELPAVHARLLEIAASPAGSGAAPSDRWLAKMSLLSRAEGDDLAWPESVAQAIRQAPNPDAENALVFCAEYYRRALAPSFPGPLWSSNGASRSRTLLDAKVRQEAVEGLSELSSQDRLRYDKALNHLWSLLGHESPHVRMAARFAMVSYPGFLVGLKNQLVRTLRGPPGRLRTEAMELMSMLEEGFLPEADYLAKPTMR